MRKLLLFAAMLAAHPALAGEPNSTVRFGIGYMAPTSGVTEFNIRWEFDHAVGLAAGYEYRLTRTIGLDATLKYFEPNIKITARRPDAEYPARSRVVPLTIGPMFHLARATSSIDVYLGPELAYVWYGETTFNVPLSWWSPLQEPVPFANSDDLAWGIKAGLDLPIRSTRISIQLEYLDTGTTNGQRKLPLVVKPVTFTLGVAWTF